MATMDTPAAKKAASKSTETKSAPAKKPVAKTPSPAKKSSSTGSSVKLGDKLFVNVDPRSNNSLAEASGIVTQVLDVTGETRVNLRVLLDDGSDMHLRNVLVTTRAKAEKDSEGSQRVAFTSAPS